MRRARTRRSLIPWFSAAALAWATPALGVEILGSGQPPVSLAAGAEDAHELSGLAHLGSDGFLAVGDGDQTLYSLDVPIDPATGQIDSAAVVGSQLLASGTDLEGLVRLPEGSVLVSDESGAAIREHDPSDGSELGSVLVPAIYLQARANFSLESLSLRVAPFAEDDALWTANEEALTVDGPLSSNVSGTVVRLQRFDESFAPDGQWAYETDPYPGSPFFALERSGVSDLLALSSGELLVLERSFSNQGFRSRIYEVDFSGATDTSGLASLDSDPYTPVGKTLRFEVFGGFLHNYEGLALGPLLDAGDQSLLLVSDDGGGSNAQALLALRIDYLPEPSALLGQAVGALALALGRAAGRVPRRRVSGGSLS